MKTAKQLNHEVHEFEKKKITQVEAIMIQNKILSRIADQLERINLKTH